MKAKKKPVVAPGEEAQRAASERAAAEAAALSTIASALLLAAAITPSAAADQSGLLRTSQAPADGDPAGPPPASAEFPPASALPVTPEELAARAAAEDAPQGRISAMEAGPDAPHAGDPAPPVFGSGGTVSPTVEKAELGGGLTVQEHATAYVHEAAPAPVPAALSVLDMSGAVHSVTHAAEGQPGGAVNDVQGLLSNVLGTALAPVDGAVSLVSGLVGTVDDLLGGLLGSGHHAPLELDHGASPLAALASLPTFLLGGPEEPAGLLEQVLGDTGILTLGDGAAPMPDASFGIEVGSLHLGFLGQATLSGHDAHDASVVSFGSTLHGFV